MSSRRPLQPVWLGERGKKGLQEDLSRFDGTEKGFTDEWRSKNAKELATLREKGASRLVE